MDPIYETGVPPRWVYMITWVSWSGSTWIKARGRVIVSIHSFFTLGPNIPAPFILMMLHNSHRSMLHTMYTVGTVSMRGVI